MMKVRRSSHVPGRLLGLARPTHAWVSRGRVGDDKRELAQFTFTANVWFDRTGNYQALLLRSEEAFTRAEIDFPRASGVLGSRRLTGHTSLPLDSG